MSLHSVKSFSHPLSLIAAALLLHIGGAVAADATGDVQQQMRAVLAGRIAIQSAPSREQHDDSTKRGTANAQDLAMQLLLGVTDSRVQGARAITPSESVVAAGVFTPRNELLPHGDAQTMARRLLLAQRNAIASQS